MTPQRYHLFQEIHRILPEIVQGGYRAKSLLWGMNFSATVVGTTVSLPVGLILPLIETVGLSAAISDKNVPNALYWAYALLGPFGDILTIKTVVDAMLGVLRQAHELPEWEKILLAIVSPITIPFTQP
jgi:hypothetical protein